MQKGQYYSVFKLLQAAVFAAVFLGIVLGAVKWLEDRSPGSDVQTVSVEVLKSAYSARDTGEDFVRPAWLRGQFFTVGSLRNMSGMPASVDVMIVCEHLFCTPQCTPADDCKDITLAEGDRISVCASCDGAPVVCRVYLGVSECDPVLW